MKNIYISMVQLPTVINKYVTFITGFSFTHFSISFDKNLNKLYAFQIKNKKIPFVGGLVEETVGSYFQGKSNISLKQVIFKIPVTDEEYLKVFNFVEDIKNDKEYMFNYVCAVSMFLNGGTKSYKSYHCVEFISEILEIINIKIPKKTYKMHPKDLYLVLKPFIIKKRIIYSKNYITSANNSFYYNINLNVAVKKSIYSIKESLCRAFLQRTSKNFNYKNINFYDKDIKKPAS